MLDVFHNDAFGVVPLTDAINNIKFVPGRIGQLGLFSEQGISTTFAAIESKDGLLELIAPTPRGGPGHTLPKDDRTIRAVMVPHFEINDAVMAEEVQGVRAWGTESEVETVQGKVADRQQLHTQSLEATHEYSRIGAVKGLITYSDNTTLDLFDFFGVTQQTVVDMDLDDATPEEGELRRAVAQIIRTIANELGTIPYAGIHAFVGDAFFDDLVAHPEVRETYMGYARAQELGTSYLTGAQGQNKAWGTFHWAGIDWENYRGGVGDVAFIDPDEAHIFPRGVPNLFRTYYAPADYIETVNTIGKRTYTKQYDMPNGKGVHLDTQMNALDICTRPRVLVKAVRT